jgi:hypothetical protein
MLNKRDVPEMSKEEKLFLFGDGEWIEEPDYNEFNHKGIDCKIVRNDVGALCGYILIPSNHSWHSKDYADIHCDVHGGLTFSKLFDDGEFWIGFDCAHSTDIAPACEKMTKIWREKMKERFPVLHASEHTFPFGHMFNPSYKNINFVTEECKKLADQAIEAANE